MKFMFFGSFSHNSGKLKRLFNALRPGKWLRVLRSLGLLAVFRKNLESLFYAL
jgi:hypothetical protein